jgi:hypothetical protein
MEQGGKEGRKVWIKEERRKEEIKTKEDLIDQGIKKQTEGKKEKKGSKWKRVWQDTNPGLLTSHPISDSRRRAK